jgi:hypothetical protein
MRPLIASTFADHVMKKEVPIERVIAANIIGAGYEQEAEMLVAMDRQQRWEYGDNLFYYGGVVESRRAEPFDENQKITPREVIVAELRAMKFQMMLTQPGMELAEWVKYTGPRGGEGWQNVETGEVTYGEKPGDVDESQEQQTLPGAKIDTSQRYTEGEVWNADIGITNMIREVTGNEDLFSLEDFYEWVAENGTEAHIREVHSRLATGPTPYEVTDDDVPYDFNVNNYEEFGRLPQMLEGDMHGVSAENMFIAQNGDNDRLFITNLNMDVNADARYEMKGAHNAVAASRLMAVMGEDTPEHHLVEGEYMAVEQSDGLDIRTHQEFYGKQAITDQRETIDRYAAHIAANIVLGNWDAHARNVFYKYGRYETIDLDMAMRDETPQHAMKMAARKFDNHLDYLYGYSSETDMKAERDEAAYLLSEELEYKAGQMQAWLTEDKKKSGISPDDLTDDQRESLEGMIQFINSGEHWQLIRDTVR